jgi:4-amino-4-deoxy-L-arabinose transferase-like glycosyltransferase
VEATRGLWIVVLLFIAANTLVWLGMDDLDRLKYAGDGDSWYKPSIGFYEHGRFVHPEAPDMATVYRPPVYPLFAAATFYLVGGPSLLAIAIAQIALLLVTGLIFRSMVNDWLPGRGNFGMALLLFNPNVFSVTQFVQSDTLFLFFVTCAIWAMLRQSRRISHWKYAAMAGTTVALATLTRPTAQFLIIVLPIAFLLMEVTSGRLQKWRRGLISGLVASFVALAIVTPWALHVSDVDGRFDLSSAEVKSRYIWDQVSMVEAQSASISYHATDTNEISVRTALAARHGGTWARMTTSEQHEAMLKEGYRTLLSYPLPELLVAYARSITQFFFAGGSGRWHYLLVEDPTQLAKAWFETSQDDIIGMAYRFLTSASGAAIAISGLCIGFVITARLIAVAGFLEMCRRSNGPLILVLVSIITYFALVHLFVGNSRYRISSEPALMFFVLFGIERIRQIWKHRQSGHAASNDTH